MASLLSAASNAASSVKSAVSGSPSKKSGESTYTLTVSSLSIEDDAAARATLGKRELCVRLTCKGVTNVTDFVKPGNDPSSKHIGFPLVLEGLVLADTKITVAVLGRDAGSDKKGELMARALESFPKEAGGERLGDPVLKEDKKTDSKELQLCKISKEDRLGSLTLTIKRTSTGKKTAASPAATATAGAAATEPAAAAAAASGGPSSPGASLQPIKEASAAELAARAGDEAADLAKRKRDFPMLAKKYDELLTAKKSRDAAKLQLEEAERASAAMSVKLAQATKEEIDAKHLQKFGATAHERHATRMQLLDAERAELQLLLDGNAERGVKGVHQLLAEAMEKRDEAQNRVKRVEANLIKQQVAKLSGAHVSNHELLKLCRELNSELGREVSPADLSVDVREAGSHWKPTGR
mgnify:CR=1 FL=1